MRYLLLLQIDSSRLDIISWNTLSRHGGSLIIRPPTVAGIRYVHIPAGPFTRDEITSCFETAGVPSRRRSVFFFLSFSPFHLSFSLRTYLVTGPCFVLSIPRYSIHDGPAPSTSPPPPPCPSNRAHLVWKFRSCEREWRNVLRTCCHARP